MNRVCLNPFVLPSLIYFVYCLTFHNDFQNVLRRNQEIGLEAKRQNENKQMNFKKTEVGAYKAKRSCHHRLRQKGLG